MQFYNVDNLPN